MLYFWGTKEQRGWGEVLQWGWGAPSTEKIQNAGNFLEHPELLKYKFVQVGGAM